MEINFLTPLSLSPNPFRLVRANSMVMRWWQMLACLYKPPDPPAHAKSSLLPDEERETLDILITHRGPNYFKSLHFMSAVREF